VVEKMNFSNWLEKWEMESLKITPPFLQMEWTPQAADKNAAWALYIELLTRITTQPLPIEHGDEKRLWIVSIHSSQRQEKLSENMDQSVLTLQKSQLLFLTK